MSILTAFDAKGRGLDMSGTTTAGGYIYNDESSYSVYIGQLNSDTFAYRVYGDPVVDYYTLSFILLDNGLINITDLIYFDVNLKPTLSWTNVNFIVNPNDNFDGLIYYTILNGNDIIYGNSFPDIIKGGNGSDIIRGYGGNDNLYGEAGSDDLYGGDGSDILDGGPGDDYLDGGTGIADAASYLSASFGVTVDLSLGRASGGGGNDRLFSIEGVIGSNYDDTIIGDDDSNVFVSTDGRDLIDGRGGVDTFMLAEDFSRYIYSKNSDGSYIVSGANFSSKLYSVESVYS